MKANDALALSKMHYEDHEMRRLIAPIANNALMGGTIMAFSSLSDKEIEWLENRGYEIRHDEKRGYYDVRWEKK